MPDAEDEQWSRISAESELKPERGLVSDVPEAQITPEPEEPLFDPIELNEVPEISADPEVSEEPEALPIQIVPFHHGAPAEVGPDVISAAPFEVRPVELPVEDAPVQEMITDVPAPHPDPVEVVADLPDHEAEPTKTPWWKLMLGGGAGRRDKQPTAAEPQVPPVPEPDSGPDPENLSS
ncbi:MAG: hypothetical protein ACOH16_13355 [Propionibacteriaceae bacterium]